MKDMNGFSSDAAAVIAMLSLAASLQGCGSKPAAETPAAPPSPSVAAKAPGSPTATVTPQLTIEPEAASVPPVVEIDPKVLAAWDGIRSPDSTAEAWEQAQQTILDQGAAVEPFLVGKLTSGDSMQRETAVMLLAQLGVPSEAARKSLTPLLKDDSEFIRANAAAALAAVEELHEDVIPVLTGLLKSDDPQLRKMAALNLNAFGPEAAGQVESLAAALDDKDTEVVLPVVQLLGRIGPKAGPTIEKLQQIAFEQSGEIKDAAESAIQLIKTE
jgi:hypothetical protein